MNANDDGTVSANSGCPATYDTGAVISVSEDQFGQNDTSSCTNTGSSHSSSTCVVDLYDCDALGGHEALPNGTWAQFVSITNHSGSDVYADSIGQLTDIEVDAPLHADIVDNGGYVLASWHLTGGATSCADVADQNGVEVDGTLVSDSTVIIPDAFDCDKGEYGFQYTDPYPAGVYQMSIDLIDNSTPDPKSLGHGDVSDVTIGDRNDIVDIGDVNIIVD